MEERLKNGKSWFRKCTKQLMFSVFFLAALFSFVILNHETNVVAGATITVKDSNHKGSANSYSAGYLTGDFRYFVQGTGVELKDVVKFEITGLNFSYDRIAIAEENYNMSASAEKKNYDSFYFSNDEWKNDATTSKNVAALLVNDVANVSALSNQLTTAGGQYIGIAHIDQANNKITYAYTLRNQGYGLKTIHVYFYNTEDSVSTEVEHITASVVVSKPISEFTSASGAGFTWQDAAATTCGKHNSNAASVTATETDRICAQYVNLGTAQYTNEARDLDLTIPKEVAYKHGVTSDPVTAATPGGDVADVSEIVAGSIYGINTFQNNGSAKFVKYYYYQISLEAHSQTVGGSSVNVTVNDMANMHENYYYQLTMKVDARGKYRFVITDFFGNVYVGEHDATNDSDNTDGDYVNVEDITSRNILVDFTNADLLTILDAGLTVTDNAEFGGNVVQLLYKTTTLSGGDTTKVMYVKMRADEAVMDAEIFTKVKITYGVWFCKAETDTNAVYSANASLCTSKIENIRKEAAKSDEIKTASGQSGYWKSAKDSLSSSDLVVSRVTLGTLKQGKSAINSDYNAAGCNNRVEITVDKNGRYRFYVVDIYGNSTDENTGVYKNPYVDVTVIDSTDPVVAGTSKENLETYDYVLGSGNTSPTVNLIKDASGGDDSGAVSGGSTTIWYTNKGDKYFNYQDLVTLLGLNAKDQTTLAGYSITYTGGAYSDPSYELYSDRYTSGLTDQYSSNNLHNYILNQDIVSFSAGLVRPAISADIDASNKFEIGGVTYTINYGTDDIPDSVSGGSVTLDATNPWIITIGTQKYYISGKRVVSYNTAGNAATKTPVIGTTYALTGSEAKETYLVTDGDGDDANGKQYVFVNTLDNVLGTKSYQQTYLGFIEIEFYDKTTGDEICRLGESATDNAECFLRMNKQIDTVRDFKIKARVYDYVGHVSDDTADTLELNVTIKDNTAPGYTADFFAQGTRDPKWTNVFTDSACMLEIGNTVHDKKTLVNCYKLAANATTSGGGTYNFVDNDTSYYYGITAADEKQLYEVTSGYANYYDSIKLEIEKDDGTYAVVDDSSSIVLSRAKRHILRITIYDNWSTKNYLQVTVEYYVNPRVLLILPIANEKVYGDADPTFDYCVFINTNIDTFSKTNEFFDIDFVNSKFKLTYCTNADAFNAYKTANSGKVSTDATVLSNPTSVGNVLLNGNVFTGALSRVESAWYNEFVGYAAATGNYIDDTAVASYTKLTGASKAQNNNVGYYDIVLGSLGIGAGSGSPVCASYGCEDDYIIKMDPRVLVNDIENGSDGDPVEGNTNLQAKQKQDKNPEKNDSGYTESNVKFTIKQAILTVVANGGSKTFGEMDLNSHNWNTKTTSVNEKGVSGYLGGYQISGFKNDSTNYYYDGVSNEIVEGVLRRTVGENVGRYIVCNLASNYPSASTCSLTTVADTKNTVTVGNYSTEAGSTFKFNAYTGYTLGGESTTAALMVRTNSSVYGSPNGRTLNVANRNYVIDYTGATYVINANEIMVQPGTNQGKEYGSSKYSDPIWEIVVYGETVTNNSGTWNSNITINESGFTGYTAAINSNSNANEVDINDYKNKSGYTDDTAIYYTRRKTSHDVEYAYEVEINLTKSDGKYTNVYSKSGDFYYLEATANPTGKYVYAYGTYHAISSYSGDKVTISVVGHLVNQSYTLFFDSTGTAGAGKISRVGDGVGDGDSETHVVGWYGFDAIDNDYSSFKIGDNGNTQCTIAATSIAVDGDGVTSTDACRNYNMNFKVSAPDKYVDSSGAELTTSDSVEELSKIITIEGTENVYKPNGIYACTDDSEHGYTSACSAAKSKEILFEIFKREIVISFDASDYIFIYGQRYDYYDGGSFTINAVTANSKNGILKVKDATSEGDIFVCYNEYHVAVTCTNSASDTTTYDYGVTVGDTWTSIGLEFYMHSMISKSDSNFYDSGSDYAIPAGTYYIYANITEAYKANYKFTYLGGTLTIKPKVTSIELTSYTKEYKETNYSSYGLGTDYSDFTEYASECMADSNYLTSSTDLINVSGCLNTDNAVGNTYGFTVEGLDSKDTIADNFTGRPNRTGNVNDNVGYYKITTGTITSKKYIPTVGSNVLLKNADGADCTAFSTSADFASKCAYVTGSEQVNYDITHSKATANEGAYLFITPATITITVKPNQTKMYGCAYSAYNVTSNYPYTIAAGYDSTRCDETSTDPNKDISYQYDVSGDKNYGSNYTVTGDMPNGTAHPNSVLSGSLYRVSYSETPITYRGDDQIYKKSENNIYQGQAVGTYTITLGDLHVVKNTDATAMCDAFNNPVLNGSVQCSNHNINYYGNSDVDATANTNNAENNAHKYTDTVTVKVSDLKTYDLNYVEYTDYSSGTYYVKVFDGVKERYVRSDELTSGVNYLQKVSDLTKYSVVKSYEKNASGTYVRINNSQVVKSDGTTAVVNDYILITALKQFGSDGGEGSGYIKINSSLVALSSINKYNQVTDQYVTYDSNKQYGRQYVCINSDCSTDATGNFVALDSLKVYTISSEDYVLVYGTLASSGLTKYKLDPKNMYVAKTGGAYVYVNGAYVLKSTLSPNAAADTTVPINSGRVNSGVTAPTGAVITDGVIYGGSGQVSNSVKFDITRRDVHVHTEYNVKYVGNDDVDEVITCEQIKTANGLTNFTTFARSYCSTATQITLGTARYYAVDNSLAKYPWTAWMDKDAGKNTNGDKDEYNDIQFDVIQGELKRLGTGTDDTVGKYPYDYAGITPHALSGHNYVIKIATITDWDNTYIETTAGTYVKLSTFVSTTGNHRYTSNACDDASIDDFNGYYIKVGGSCKSISAVSKRRDSESGASINFWYLGFYRNDDSDGRTGELAKWWNNSSIFANSYSKLIQGKDNAGQDLTASDGYLGIEVPTITGGREVYFEIIRRTIYLYAIDNSKIYGASDKYDDYKVAICATDNGYTVTNDGKVKCNDPATVSETHGLSETHRAKYYDDDGYMKQNVIKGGTGYTFSGTATDSFRIYFKRTPGEDVGVYSVTACALQTGITDCSDPAQEESISSTEHIGDNYVIIEMPGTLTINTRKITIVPDADQGFMYGNYPNNGAIPAITYKEYFEYSGGTGSQGTVNSGASDTASNKATCLINISGESVVCINDNQNDTVAIDTSTKNSYVFLKGDGTTTGYTDATLEKFVNGIDAEKANLASNSDQRTNNGVTYYVRVNSVYKDSYSDPDNVGSRRESDTRSALNRVCGSTEDLRYGRDVCNYVIVDGELEVGTTWVENTINEYVKIVKSNVFTENNGSTVYNPGEGQTYNATGNWLKVGERYYSITAANRYTYKYVQANGGAYILIDSNYYKIVDANKFSDASCTSRNLTGTYYKQGSSSCKQITDSIRYNLSKELVQNATGEFLKIGGTASDKVYNYTIEGFTENVGYEVTTAALKVTPIEGQSKIYGEADPEIQFAVYTTYTVKSDHCIPKGNVQTINGANSGFTACNITGWSATDYYKVTAGDVVVLVGYAYAENMSEATLNYGRHLTYSKHAGNSNVVEQAAGSAATHFDAFTTYEDKIYDGNTYTSSNGNNDESRILIGNLFADNHDQNVGQKKIRNGFIVGVNGLVKDSTKYKNYTLTDDDVNGADDTVVFTVIPRPIYLKIADITKEYGRATDSTSCDSGVTCTVDSGILLTEETEMQYNYSIVTSGMTNALPTNPTGGVAVYTNAAINISSVTGSVPAGYAGLVTTQAKYYTASTEKEVKNEHLQTIVERGNFNVTRDTNVCFVAAEKPESGKGKGCEDVGQYYLRFAGKNTALSDEANEVAMYYHGNYWGYNSNYYVIIENTVSVSKDTDLMSTSNANGNTVIMDADTQVKGATLTINKKSIQIVVETFTSRDAASGANFYKGELGDMYSIEENMDVPTLPKVDSTKQTHTTYKYITWAVHPAQVRTTDEITGNVAYYPARIETLDGNVANKDKYALVQQKGDCSGGSKDGTDLDCSTNALVYHESNDNNANTGPKVFDTSSSGYYAITRDRDVLYIRFGSDESKMNFNGATKGAYEANNYTTEFVNGVLAIDDDNLAPTIYAGTEFYAIEANAGTTTNINAFGEDDTYSYLNSLKTNDCKAVTGRTGETLCDYTEFSTAIPVTANKFKLKGYEYQIDGSSIKGISNTGTTISITTSGDTKTFTMGSDTYTIMYNDTTPIFIAKKGTTANLELIKLSDILQWFNIQSHDPGVVRSNFAGTEVKVPKRYDARYYFAIDENFNQRVVGDYTVFIYAVDDAQNISRATTVTLRVKDTTNPVTGTMTLYQGEISCNFGSVDCVSDSTSWVGTKHNSWSNNTQGIWMSVTGGEDNSINYLNIDGRQRYTISGNSITKSNSGGYILYGTILALDNMTQYFKQGNNYIVRDPKNSDANYNAQTFYIRRINGTKYEYVETSSLERYTLSGETYTKVTDGTIDGTYFVDGELKQLPSNRYKFNSGKLTLDASGTYIKLDQWDHYYSRDNGATWIKYDREDVNGYLVLESDGQRLIMIKAVDKGVEYTEEASVNTSDSTAKKYFDGTYAKIDTNVVGGITWVVDAKDASFTEFSKKTDSYNVSAWADALEGGYYRDRQYAYLDTQRPLLTLDDNSFEVYEYGCPGCTSGYAEEYGQTSDSYLLELSKFKRYSDAAATTIANSGKFIKVEDKENSGKDKYRVLDITGRTYDETAVAQASCTGKWIDSKSKCYVKNGSDNGAYVYIGVDRSADITETVDSTMTDWITASANRGSSIKVNANNGAGSTEEFASVALRSKAATEQIELSTIYNVSGISGANVMKAVQNTAKTFEELDHLHKHVTIYLAVAEPHTRSTVPTVTGGIFGSASYSVGYFKYVITCADASSTCTINATASASDKTVSTGSTYTVSVGNIVEKDGLTGAALTNAKLLDAIYSIVSNTLATNLGDTYKGKDLTFSINYNTTDMAGNVSKNQVRGIVMSNFLEAVRIEIGGAAASEVIYDSYSVDVAQNASVLSVLGDFSVSTSKSDENPAYDRNLVQTVYYNGTKISDNARYDSNTLANLDTTVPGTYTIVYSTRRMYNGEMVYGTPFELTINVKPDTAITANNIDYKQVVITSFVAVSVILIFAYVYMSSKKRKFN